MIKFFVPIVFILTIPLLVSCQKESKPATSGFDQLCEVFNELKNLAGVSQLSQEEKSNFILENMSKKIQDPIVSNSWEAVRQATPESRYQIFKDGAEEVTGEPWDCPNMQALAASAGATPEL